MIPKYVTGSALGDLGMVLSDISQYLQKNLGDPRRAFEIGPPWATPDDGATKTTDPDQLLHRAKLVKDLAIRCAGGEPLSWGWPDA